MKNALPLLLVLFTITTVLCGCPYDSPYAIDEQPQLPVDESLLGKWAAFVTRPSDDRHHIEEPVKIIFEKATDMEYNIAITGYINELKPYKVIANDTIKGTAFLSDIRGRKILNSFINGKYYIAEVLNEKGNLSVLTLNEHFTAKYVKSSAALRAALEFHYKTRVSPNYDEWFVLKNLQKVN